MVSEKAVATRKSTGIVAYVVLAVFSMRPREKR